MGIVARGRRRSTRSAGSTRRRHGASSRGSSGARRLSQPRVDPDKLLDSIVDEAVQRLGLGILGLDRESYKEMLKPLVEGIVERYSSRPSKDAIVSRLQNAVNNVYILASAYLLEKLEKLTPEQLEFVVTYGGPIAAKYASRLYKEIVESNRRDLLPLLRSAWEQYGRPTPIACPRCGFRAVTPDLVCMVCGYTLSEREAKEAIDFNYRLEEFVELYPASDVREAIERGVVVVGDTLKPPSAPREPTDIVLHLTRSERDRLRKLLEERKASYARGPGA